MCKVNIKKYPMFLGFPTYVLMPKIADYRFLLALLIANHDKLDSGSNKHFTTEKIIPTLFF